MSRSREEILREQRRAGIGGSDAAAILGLHPYKSIHSVWLEKCGFADEQTQSEAAKWGLLVEPVLLADYAKERSVSLKTADPDDVLLVTDPKYPFLLGHPDAFVTDDNGGVDAKMAGLRQIARWGEEQWSDEVPEEYLIQCQVYVGLSHREYWDITALIGQERRIYRIPPDRELFEIIAETSDKFWRDHVLTKTPPPPDASETSRQIVLARFPQNKEPLRAATDEEINLARKLYLADQEFESAKTRYDALQTILSDHIGLADGIEGRIVTDEQTITLFGLKVGAIPDVLPFKITFRKNRDGFKTDWKAAFVDLTRAVVGAVPDAKDVAKAIERKYTIATPGPRVFRPTFEEKE